MRSWSRDPRIDALSRLPYTGGEFWSRIEHLAGPRVPSDDFEGTIQ